MDASLFCPKPCVLATFDLDSSEHCIDRQAEEAAKKIAIRQLLEIGVDLTYATSSIKSSLPLYIGLSIDLVEAIMRRLDLYCEPAITVQDGKQNRVFVAFVERDRLLTFDAVARATTYVMSVFSRNEHKKTIELPRLLTNLKQLLVNVEKSGKSRTSKELQHNLMTANKPWFSLDFDKHNKNCLQAGFGRQQQYLDGAISFDSSFIGVMTSLSKIKSRQFLAQSGFQVPRQFVVKNAEHACQQARHLGYPVVLKSDVGAYGHRVYADLRSCEELAAAFHVLENDLRRYGEKHTIFVENHLEGKVYRVEVVKGQFFDAYDMVPAGVTGDGKHTVRELVAIENTNPERGGKTEATTRYIHLELKAAELLMLEKQNMTVESIPENGQVVRLRANSNWSCGGTYEKVTELIHPDNKLLAERAAVALKIDLLGVDLITSDISKSFIENDLTIIEVNHSPAITGSHENAEDKFDDTARRLIERMLPDVAYGDVPVIMFKAAGQSYASALLFADYFNRLGYSAGLINQQGMSVNGQVWAKPERVDFQNPGLQLLRNNTVGAAIIERSVEDLVNFGLGTGGCDIAVVLDCKNKSITTPVWRNGMRSSEADRFLCQSARLANIILVDSVDSIELCRQCETDKLFALFPVDSETLEQSLELDSNRIKIRQHTEDGVLLDIVYKKSRFEKWLKRPGIDNALPYIAILATLLVLDLELEKIWTLLESE